MRGEVFSGYLSTALLDVGNFTDIAAAFKNRERLRDFAFGGVHHCFAELGIALAADGIEPGGGHSGLLHLIDGPARFDCMMLALVAHEDDSLHALLECFVEEPVNLPGGEQARLVDDPDFA
jgi:hypothetical protein